MKRILICLPSLHCGDGIANVIMKNYEYLIQKNVQIDFFLVLNKEISKEYYNKIVKNNGKIYILPPHSKFIKFLYAKLFLKKIIKSNTYDIVHINLRERYAYACAINAYKKAKIIYHVHNPRVKSKIGILGEFINRLIIKKSDLLMACSNDAGKSMFNSEKFIVFKNKIKIELFKFNNEYRLEIRKKLNLKENNILIGTVARITEQKNPLFALDIIEKCIEENNNIYYIWIGNGEQKALFEKKIHENSLLKEHVIVLEKSEEIEKYYSAMDIFILPSKYEGFGIVALESQASGLPTLVSEYFPLTTKETNLIKYLEIKDSELWKDNLIKTKINTENRVFYNKFMRDAEANTEEQDNCLYKIYMNIQKR